jgi:hypothetical protein
MLRISAGSILVVGGGLHNNRNTARPVSFVHQLFDNPSPNLACSLLDRPLNRVIRTSSKDGGEDLS